MSKKLFIKTWGCQMNVYDSARMADVLAPLGYTPSDEADGADMVILNTCHIREKAAEKVFSELGRLRHLKDEKARAGDKMVLAVAGCVAQAEGEEIVARAPFVDIVFGPQTYHTLPEMVAKAHRAAGAVLNTDFPAESKFDHLPEDSGGQGVSAFLAVQEGCDKFCTFCVVPYTRGAEFSRPAFQVLAEAKRMVANGTREINLLGQNVNAYHGEAADGSTWSLARLIRELADIDGLARIRYTTSHPRDLADDLIRAHAEVPQLMPYLHLPVQAGSDRILAAMNRKHTADHYRAIVDKLRAANPDLALSGDFIVGFPGESDADFAETLRLVNDVTYAQAYSFKYSPRPGTPASTEAKQVPEDVKSERLAALQQLIDAQQVAFNAGFVGRTVPVLFDRPGKRPGQLMGRSPHMQSVYVQAPERLVGTIADVRIEAAHANSLAGTVETGVYVSRTGHSAEVSA
ncbi:tRNA (N6-isopentenyl adenosine(37)-C2)-methylthiotransferase MiaB [Azospirillum sp.]|uniref:tRNA (N6-isopentenyl adenosine(37)-C2)-methylthiotransferase MiaB n=1 Tax=Azospirillum sp. TaxID=34012 RepID=UPI003D74847D